MRLTEENYRFIAKSIVSKLYRRNCWGKGHMLVDRFKHSLPPHLRGCVNIVLKDLMAHGIILPYGPTKHGFAVHLNKSKKAEIRRILQL